MSKKVWRSRPSFCASTKASQVATMVAPRIMLLQILAAWPAPSCAGVDHRLGHRLEEWPGALELLVGAADHEGQGARRRPRRSRPRPARRRSRSPWPSSPRRPRARWRRRWSSSRSAARRAWRSARRRFRYTARTCLRGGKHGDDDVGVLDRFGGRRRRPCSRPRPHAATASATRSKARTSCPALARFGAIPPPMWPRPMNAMRAMT